IPQDPVPVVPVLLQRPSRGSVNPGLSAAAVDSYTLRPFKAAPWLPGPHLQTVLGKFLRPSVALQTRRVRLELDDGDFLDLDLGPCPSPGAPLVVVLHGLEGSIQRPYARLALQALVTQGIQPVGMNFRSCSGEPNRTLRFYHSGETDDFRAVLSALERWFPSRPVGALGFSLGGNVLLKWLGEEGEGARKRLRAAATVSVPFDLAAGTKLLEEGLWGRIYTHYFLRSLKEKAQTKASRLGNVLEMERILSSRTLREWDDAVTAPLHGFKDAQDYYVLSSSKGFLPDVRIPALLIQADDDPFLPRESLPTDEVGENPFLKAAFTRGGGHVGFVAGSSPAHRFFWAESEAARFLGWALTDSA
ncbi:MAG: hydrolase, partial [Gemmatimonadota bacterium]